MEVKNMRMGVVCGLLGYSFVKVGYHNDPTGLIYIGALMIVLMLEIGE